MASIFTKCIYLELVQIQHGGHLAADSLAYNEIKPTEYVGSKTQILPVLMSVWVLKISK